MSDDPASFRAKNAAQFSKAEKQLEDIGKEFIILVAEDVIKTTRGFGNQRPGRRNDASTDIRYAPTGQLRGGWYWSAADGDRPGYWDGGPTSDYGAEPIADITSKVRAAPLVPVSYVQNSVNYAWIVRWGRGYHLMQDTWILDTAGKMNQFAIEARARVMSSGG